MPKQLRNVRYLPLDLKNSCVMLRNVRYLPLDLKNSCVMFAICNFISQKATITNERKPMLIRTTEFAQTKRRLQVANDNLSTHTTLRVQA